MMSIASSSKMIISKYQKQMLINKSKNEEKASFIKIIGDIGKRLYLFVIFKKKKKKNE